MPSQLFNPPASNFSPAQAFALKKAELDIHQAAMEMVEEVSEQLPPAVKHMAQPIAASALICTLGRILAGTSNQVGAHLTIANLAQLVATEQRYWQGGHQLH
jgi:hypothetical protein